MSNLNFQNKYDSYLVDFSNIKKIVKRTAKKLVKKFSNKSGYMLIFLVFFFFMVGISLITGPVLTTTRELQIQLLRSQMMTANATALSLNSPIRNRVVDEIYKRVQVQLIQHLRDAAGSTQYKCQGQYTQPSSTDPVTGASVGDLQYQFGLCSPETLLLGLDGDTNQTLDLLSSLYPDYKKPLSVPINEQMRQTLIKNNENNYNYTLRTTYAGEEVLSQGPSSSLLANRLERYHYQVRADVELFTHTYKEVRSPVIIYYDVFILNSFYSNPFYGGGSACDEQPSSSFFETTRPDLVREADGSIHVYVEDPNDKVVGGGCIDSYLNGEKVTQCTLNGNRTTIAYPPKQIRIQNGCASISSGVPGVTTADPNGYGFGITVRTVSYGKPYS